MKYAFLFLPAYIIAFFACSQNTVLVKKNPDSILSNNRYEDSVFAFKDDWPTRKFHGGIGFTMGFLNANNSINEGISFQFSYDFLKSKKSALSIGTNIKWGWENFGWKDVGNVIGAIFGDGNYNPSQTTSTAFAEFPLLLNYNLNFGIRQDQPPVFGFYFGGGITYVITAYESKTNLTEGANFYGYLFNGGIRHGALDIGIQKVFSLRKPIDQIQTPTFFEVTISAHF